MAKKLALELNELTSRESRLYEFRKPDSSPILLILDRKSDLITPLLFQWTYQAMIHDIFGIRNGRVGLKADLHSEHWSESEQSFGEEYTLSAEQDLFYRENVDSNFGDLGENVRILVQAFQSRTMQHQSQLDSIPSMKKFIEDYPEYRKMASYVSKHVALVGEISKRVERMHLMEISELEQTIATQKSPSSLYPQLLQFLARADVLDIYKLKVSLVYALRCSQTPNFDFLNFTDNLRAVGFSQNQISVLNVPVVLCFRLLISPSGYLFLTQT